MSRDHTLFQIWDEIEQSEAELLIIYTFSSSNFKVGDTYLRRVLRVRERNCKLTKFEEDI